MKTWEIFSFQDEKISVIFHRTFHEDVEDDDKKLCLHIIIVCFHCVRAAMVWIKLNQINVEQINTKVNAFFEKSVLLLVEEGEKEKRLKFE